MCRLKTYTRWKSFNNGKMFHRMRSGTPPSAGHGGHALKDGDTMKLKRITTADDVGMFSHVNFFKSLTLNKRENYLVFTTRLMVVRTPNQ